MTNPEAYDESLPMIPEDAIRDGWWNIGDPDAEENEKYGPGLSHMPVRMPARDTAARAISGGWHRLYAASLRHAADVALPRDRTSHRPMTYEQVGDWLRRLATEAEADDA